MSWEPEPSLAGPRLDTSEGSLDRRGRGPGQRLRREASGGLGPAWGHLSTLGVTCLHCLPAGSPSRGRGCLLPPTAPAPPLTCRC